MTPRDFLVLVVLPNIEDARRDVGDVRQTYNAVMSVDALAAHVFHWCRANLPNEVQGLKDDTGYRLECGRHHALVQMLHDIAKAAKHVELTRGSPTIRTFAEVQPRKFGFGEGGFGIGPFGGGEQVSVLVDGQKVQVDLLLSKTAEFYTDIMDRLGIPT